MCVFEYSPLDLSFESFRLIRLIHGNESYVVCELFEAWLYGDNTINFEALSYTWGSPDLRETINVNGKELSVTENLFFALRNLRSPVVDKVFWIDAVCIDQSNLSERAHQVRQMGKIYSQAERVIFWLGRSNEETEVLMKFLKSWERDKHFGEGQSSNVSSALLTTSAHNVGYEADQMSDSIVENYERLDKYGERQRLGMIDLLSRSWFQRVWILQEVANAKRAIVACGTMEVNARIFACAPERLGVEVLPHSQAVLDIMPGQSRATSWWSEKNDLYTLLQKFKRSRAGDARDMIYALLDICSDNGNTLQADYTKSEAELVNDAVEVLFDIPCPPSLHTMAQFLESFSMLNTDSLIRIVQLSDMHEVMAFLETGRELSSNTAEVIEAAASNTIFGENIITLLRQEKSAWFENITEKALIEAAANTGCGVKLMQLLCGAQGTYNTHDHERYTITERVVIAGAENTSCGVGVIEFLVTLGIDTVSSSVVLEAAARARNNITPNKIAQLLLKQRGSEPYAAAARGSKAMVTLLFRQGIKTEIPEMVFKAAAENKRAGADIMTLLIKHGNENNITEEVLNAAARNRQCGDQILALIVQDWGRRRSSLIDFIHHEMYSTEGYFWNLKSRPEQSRGNMSTALQQQDERKASEGTVPRQQRSSLRVKITAFVMRYNEKIILRRLDKFLRKEVQIRHNMHGRSHGRSLASVATLALLCIARGRLEEGAELMHGVIQVQRAGKEIEIHTFVPNMICLICIYHELGRVEEAQQLSEEVDGIKGQGNKMKTHAPLT